MRIAVTTENETIFQHFGQSSLFTIYDVEQGEIQRRVQLDTGSSGHGALAGLLSGLEVNTVICGGIGGGARGMLQTQGIAVVSGISGGIDDAVRAYLGGTLQDMGSSCSHHEHEAHHDCSCHAHCH